MANHYTATSRLALGILGLGMALAACGGGSGGPVPSPVASPTPAPTLSPTPKPTATASPTPLPTATPPTGPTVAPSGNVTGKVVDAITGTGLGGVSIGLAPWAAGATPAPKGTSAPDGTFAFSAGAGHYLLVIGSNATGDTTYATVHDNVTLTGGLQALQAPTLPPVPTVTPSAAQTSGNYRLALIDPVREKPCFDDFNAFRIGLGLAGVVEDEWLIENARAINQYRAAAQYAPPPWPGNSYGYLTTGISAGSGNVPCSNLIVVSNYVTSPQTLWFGGSWYSSPARPGSGVALDEYSLDPRAFTDPNVPVWP